tara:strand:+ start:1687 stop:2112 length:426 start_codon:yes stop_codon:yes gene_type:complete
MEKNKEWKDVRIIKASGKRTWVGGAYTIAFVYSNKGNFILKGFGSEIREYLSSLKNKGYKYIVNETLWSANDWTNKKQFRSIWSVSSSQTYLYEPSPEDKGKTTNKFKWRLFRFDENSNKIEKTFKRLPKKWVSEYDKIIL